MKSTLSKIWRFYYEGFSTMGRTGKTLWLIILLKLFIMFAILKVFFFRSELSRYDTDEEKSEAVIDNLTDRVPLSSRQSTYRI